MFATLQTCRAFASVIVVLFHLGATLALDKYFGIKAFARPFIFGHAGVDFFFVLSGFIIVHIHHKEFGCPARLLNYLKRRVVRIYPVYWLIFLGVYLAAMPFAGLRETLPTELPTILKALLLIPQDPLRVGGTGAPVLIVAWSLQYEIVFYSIVAVLVASRVFGAAVIAAIVVLYLFQPFGHDFPFGFFQKEWLLLFALGGLVAWINSSALSIRFPRLLALFGIILFMANGLSEVFAVSIEPGSGSLIYGVASACIILGLIRAELAGTANAWKPGWAILLGDASYALYLIHFPLISIICKVAIMLGLSGIMGAIVTYIIALFLCLGSALVFHLWIEKPILRYFNPKRRVHQLATK